jgi:hypothetical protein
VIGKKVSKSSEDIHREFKYILSCIRYKEGRTKVFKQIVLTRWCDEYEDALKSTHEINRELDKLKDERLKTIRKFNRDEITYADKESSIKEIDTDISDWQSRKAEADEYADKKEKIVDNALLFLKDPSEFWNRAPVQIQRRVQRTIFPNGLRYDFEKVLEPLKLTFISVNKENSRQVG